MKPSGLRFLFRINLVLAKVSESLLPDLVLIEVGKCFYIDSIRFPLPRIEVEVLTRHLFSL
jgi:hypothetical protein